MSIRSRGRSGRRRRTPPRAGAPRTPGKPVTIRSTHAVQRSRLSAPRTPLRPAERRKGASSRRAVQPAGKRSRALHLSEAPVRGRGAEEARRTPGDRGGGTAPEGPLPLKDRARPGPRPHRRRGPRPGRPWHGRPDRSRLDRMPGSGRRRARPRRERRQLALGDRCGGRPRRLHPAHRPWLPAAAPRRGVALAGPARWLSPTLSTHLDLRVATRRPRCKRGCAVSGDPRGGRPTLSSAAPKRQHRHSPSTGAFVVAEAWAAR